MGKQKKSDKLPKIGEPARTVLLAKVTLLPDYIDHVQKGLPLFKAEELERLRKQYKGANDLDAGMTWEDIDNELSRKGIKLRKATFRKYIQQQYLPGAIRYKRVGDKRVAVFPSDTINHINFIQYFYNYADTDTLGLIVDILNASYTEITYFDAIESRIMLGSIHSEIIAYIARGNDEGLIEAIEMVLHNRKDDKDMILSRLGELNKEFERTIEKSVNELISYLKDNTIRLSEIPDRKDSKVDAQ